MPVSQTSFSLLDEPWIPVLDRQTRRRDVSLRQLFAEASEIQMIACELPTQTLAVLRLALAVLHRASDGPNGEAAWRELWHGRQLPLADVEDYLNSVADRFDLLHPVHPFYQVADLRADKDNTYGLERLIADVPNGLPYLTTRAAEGMTRLSPAEAALWLVHCEAWDPSGIKTGAMGDPRVKGGRGYPIGVSSLGSLGAVHLEGETLLETLLLNLVPIAPGWREPDDRDLPSWEREPQTAAEEADATRGPFGLLSLYTWQSRRIRLFGDRDGVTGAMISNGDRFEWQDRQRLEPMSVWGRSGPREKEQKRVVYLPRPHEPARSLWRGLQTLLPPPPPASDEAPKRLSPLVLQWLAHLWITRAVDGGLRVRTRATSISYGSNQSVIDEVFSDSLTMHVQLLVEGSDLRTAAVDSAADAEKAVGELRKLAVNLARAAGGSDAGGDADRAAEEAYARLDKWFREWLATLRPGTDPLEARRNWQNRVRLTLVRLGRSLVDAAGEKAWVGRVVTNEGRDTHYCSPLAEAWFRSKLTQALPLASASIEKKQEVTV
ncbi:type I-E CRISPR-associated protein Cse1/CasA [Catellatospora sp. KI3]|uniref:type I-E CRISPR-associated protein Cse1/CasA n=1 Tax=Catellatospora sp. KI3 TaxID=3041620 RepID=UPI0024823BE0|nr:type I-E CRISPR-associated protein Cse1/CasA [Catellatospora sp. KI3]MDI1461085.1 type I-E CRISPR-associated protein Cse1/CasA [Catellatospora sp. KI3]